MKVQRKRGQTKDGLHDLGIKLSAERTDAGLKAMQTEIRRIQQNSDVAFFLHKLYTDLLPSTEIESGSYERNHKSKQFVQEPDYLRRTRSSHVEAHNCVAL